MTSSKVILPTTYTYYLAGSQGPELPFQERAEQILRGKEPLPNRLQVSTNPTEASVRPSRALKRHPHWAHNDAG